MFGWSRSSFVRWDGVVKKKPWYTEPFYEDIWWDLPPNIAKKRRGNKWLTSGFLGNPIFRNSYIFGVWWFASIADNGKGASLAFMVQAGIGTKHGKPKCSAQHRSRSRGLTASSQHPYIGKRDRKQRLETSMHCNLLYSPHIHEKHWKPHFASTSALGSPDYPTLRPRAVLVLVVVVLVLVVVVEVEVMVVSVQLVDSWMIAVAWCGRYVVLDVVILILAMDDFWLKRV